jgi:maltooligosyltrehalose trehalohydrolase
MRREGERWRASVPGLGAGARYKCRLDGGEAYPDPCSRSQPEGVHGPSEVVDPAAHRWGDAGWRPPDASYLVIYECHVGTLTPEGTFDAAIGQLPRLRELGVTAIELMPVAASPGRWNWGYDGAALYAPYAPYGGPEGLRRLVDAAHRAGLAVLLDVVYNHFGPSGNYTGLYSDRYLTSQRTTPWGDAINFDGPGAGEVRRFFTENLLHWVHEHHIDGFRLDATFAIYDESAVHILAELVEALKTHPRPLADGADSPPPYMIAETHENDPRYLRPPERGGLGFDGVWADDFHHILRRLLTHEGGNYLGDYEGTGEELARVIEQGFYYEGQPQRRDGKPRGAPARTAPWRSFVYCIQNHDQVGNLPFGQRLHLTASHADYLAASLLLLLLPQTPLLFQGQEFLASSPFLFFSDHEPELGRLVTEGRRRDYAGFPGFSDPVARERIPDPQDPRTFERSRLPLDEATYGAGALCADLYRELLRLRADDPALREARRGRPPLRATRQDRAVLVNLGAGEARRVLVANFGEETGLPLEGAAGLEAALHTGEPRFGGHALSPELRASSVRMPPHTAAYLRPRG